jgi:hypothetical protein
MCGWDGGEKESNGDWVMGPKVGQLTLSMGPARAEVHSYVQRGSFIHYTIIKYHTCNGLILCTMLQTKRKDILSSPGKK